MTISRSIPASLPGTPLSLGRSPDTDTALTVEVRGSKFVREELKKLLFGLRPAAPVPSTLPLNERESPVNPKSPSRAATPSLPSNPAFGTSNPLKLAVTVLPLTISRPSKTARLRRGSDDRL